MMDAQALLRFKGYRTMVPDRTVKGPGDAVIYLSRTDFIPPAASDAHPPHQARDAAIEAGASLTDGAA